VDVLLPFDRSRSVIENEDITKIPLWTGPQAIGGSTRMQASTSEQYAISVMIEQALTHALKNKVGLSEDEM
jgi:N-acetylmuramic acid 6-phosphate etherase